MTNDLETDSDDDAILAAPPSQMPAFQAMAAKKQYIWCPAGRQPSVAAFMGMQGPTSAVVVTDTESPLQYFRLIFGDALMDLLVEETNRYASQYLTRQNLTSLARGNAWKSTNMNEIKVFLGLVLLTGLIDKKGSLALYSSKDELIATPFFNKCMSRNRSQLLTAFLHFNDNDQMPVNCDDKLYKIRPVYSIMFPDGVNSIL